MEYMWNVILSEVCYVRNCNKNQEGNMKKILLCLLIIPAALQARITFKLYEPNFC